MVDLSGVFGAAFAGIYADGTLYRVTASQDEGGSRSFAKVASAIKVQADDLSEVARVAAGYTAKDARFLVLQAGARPAPTSQDELVVGGVRYAVKSVSADPASTHWIVRAEKV